MARSEAWKSEWIPIHDDIDPKVFIICKVCSYNLGYYGDITEDRYPKMCPKCKRDMTNGAVREYD